MLIQSQREMVRCLENNEFYTKKKKTLFYVVVVRYKISLLK